MTDIIYLAGPMTGKPRWGFDAFEEAATALRARGYGVLSPAEADVANGFDPDAVTTHEFTIEDYAEAFRRDVTAILEADGVALLPGWEDSRGATLEENLAQVLRLDVRPLAGWLAEEVAA